MEEIGEERKEDYNISVSGERMEDSGGNHTIISLLGIIKHLTESDSEFSNVVEDIKHLLREGGLFLGINEMEEDEEFRLYETYNNAEFVIEISWIILLYQLHTVAMNPLLTQQSDKREVLNSFTRFITREHLAQVVVIYIYIYI